jgi:hypothetical protein
MLHILMTLHLVSDDKNYRLIYSILYCYTFTNKNYVLKHAGRRFPSNFEGTHDNEAGPSRINISDIVHGNFNCFTTTYNLSTYKIF